MPVNLESWWVVDDLVGAMGDAVGDDEGVRSLILAKRRLGNCDVDCLSPSSQVLIRSIGKQRPVDTADVAALVAPRLPSRRYPTAP